jgi:hypothetical protein
MINTASYLQEKLRASEPLSKLIVRPKYRRDVFQTAGARISRAYSVENQEGQAQDELIGKFLDFLWEDCLRNPSHLVPFTAEMAQAPSVSKDVACF